MAGKNRMIMNAAMIVIKIIIRQCIRVRFANKASLFYQLCANIIFSKKKLMVASAWFSRKSTIFNSELLQGL